MDARPVIAGQTVMVTRRCTQRLFLLQPCALVNQILLYCLAVAAQRYEVEIHAFCFLANHWHAIITDLKARRPEFYRWFHEFVAKCLNAHYGRWENIWATEPTSVVLLTDDGSQIDKLLYVTTNPVAAGLVPHSDEWPGVHSRPSDIGRTITVARPAGFFRAGGSMPEVATLRLTKLPALAHLSDEQYVEQLDALIVAKETELRAEVRAEGRSFMGRAKVLRQSPFDSPRSHEPRRQLNPRVAGRSKWARIEAIQRLKSFIDDYRQAWSAFRRGDRAALFPHGTYWMRRYAGVTCAAPA